MREPGVKLSERRGMKIVAVKSAFSVLLCLRWSTVDVSSRCEDLFGGRGALAMGGHGCEGAEGAERLDEICTHAAKADILRCDNLKIPLA